VAAEEGRIEIALPNGVQIRVGNDVAVEPLRRVLAALAG
jgi:transposase